MTDKKKPLVSVIIPTWNRVEYLFEALNSVFQQSYPHIEIIVVDDGSTDDTKARLEPLINKGKIRYFYQENQGQSAARNLAISKMKGAYACFLDSDDHWFPHKVEAQVELMKTDSNIAICYGDMNLIDSKGHFVSHWRMPHYSGYVMKQLLLNNFISMPTVMIKADALVEQGGFDEQIRFAPDYDLWLRISPSCQIIYLDSILAEYRVMDEQLSSDKAARMSSNKKVMQSFIEQHKEELPPAFIRHVWNTFYCRWTRVFALKGEFNKSLLLFLKAFYYKPFALQTWRAFVRVCIRQRVYNNEH